MGKTSVISVFRKILEEKGVDIDVVSSDVLRKRAMD